MRGTDCWEAAVCAMVDEVCGLVQDVWVVRYGAAGREKAGREARRPWDVVVTRLHEAAVVEGLWLRTDMASLFTT